MNHIFFTVSPAVRQWSLVAIVLMTETPSIRLRETCKVPKHRILSLGLEFVYWKKLRGKQKTLTKETGLLGVLLKGTGY